jgi:hypothetical protein
LSPLAALLEDSEWFPTGLSQDYRTVLFGRTTRDALANEAFLDQRMSDAVTDVQQHPVDAINATQDLAAYEPPAFIFHSAFCCSTLLARALDIPGQCLSLKEPDVLMGAANALRMQEDAAANTALVRSITGLLSRRFDAAESILIKPTNSANNLLPHMADLGSKVLILYGDLRSFLVSVLKKGEACKSFVRTQYNIFALDDPGVATIPARQAMTFTDLQVAALVWRHQLESFQRELLARPDSNIASLDFRSLVEHPAATLEAVARHLGLSHERSQLDDIANGPVFSRNAKFGDEAYDAGQRARDEASVAEQHAEALDQVEQWAQSLSLGTAFDLPLAKPLAIPG